ncbi:G-type lectin S-receptor-like serine/threonine-protein kinase At2g19130 [Panicum virgatum]|uniref:Receptor-like serine/threonine-protein kinase n=1 Tax=Panicum virgatum TaxID=38727 RepID=A0A8T0WXC9_PANVG|nr:G-type lectin S-receptor-like serine/threonine-protein kinase At2g19130 [Panicum virgatum]KAG2650276.1 hypothetical protein PVAP13_1NG221600 [Panicum virgatum]
MVANCGQVSSPVLVLLAFLFLHGAPLRAADDTIFDGQPLYGGQSLVSKRGKFELGFFQPDNSSQRWYVGIRYNQISARDIVWVANREAPIANLESSQLSIARDGNMVLLDHRNSPIWSTNVTTIASSVPTVGVILDTGNLVLAEASNTSVVLWQSFDHFTDTWLPGGKLGRNKLTGEVDRLVAWRGYKDPSPSMFSLELDPRGTSQYLLNWNSSEQYWTSGNWSAADHIFTDVPEMTLADPSHGFPYTFSYVDAGNESYFAYHVEDDAVVAHFRMDVAGQVKFLMWVEGAGEWQQFWSQPKAQCDIYAMCGPSGVGTENALPSCSCPRGFRRRRPLEWAQGDYTSGCARNAALQCGGGARDDVNGGEDRFYAMADVRLPSDGQSVVAASAGDCERACVGSCSCTAYSYNGSCSVWQGDLINLRDTSGMGTATGVGGTIWIRLAASEFSSAGRDRGRRLFVGLVAAGFAAAVTIIIVLVPIIVVTRRRTSRRVVEGSLVAFTYRDLQLATKNFSEKLGAGAFSSVFKGSLADDAARPVAVKKLEGHLQGEKQFRAEVSTIGKVQHVNLIRLIGFYSEGTRRLLVYEHMSNGSLDRHLFGATSSSHLSWEARYQVALGIARGLDYLHGSCRDCIIHCDIKPENILLDGALAPKVADFGLAKLMGRDSSRVLTTVRGTAGYLAPEWVAGTAVTAKADVFSYGMVLFELVSGRRNARQRPDGTVDFFPSTAAGLLVGGGDLMGAVDGRIRGDADVAEVERACRIACWCVQDDERARPSMGTVVQVLEGLLEVSVPPIPTSFKMLANPSKKHLDFFTCLPSA